MTDDETVDVDFLSGSMSDMLDMTFTSSVAQIFEECEMVMEDSDPMCPVVDTDHDDYYKARQCQDKCNPDHTGGLSDCAEGHYCCKYDIIQGVS